MLLFLFRTYIELDVLRLIFPQLGVLYLFVSYLERNEDRYLAQCFFTFYIHDILLKNCEASYTFSINSSKDMSIKILHLCNDNFSYNAKLSCSSERKRLFIEGYDYYFSHDHLDFKFGKWIFIQKISITSILEWPQGNAFEEKK